MDLEEVKCLKRCNVLWEEELKKLFKKTSTPRLPLALPSLSSGRQSAPQQFSFEGGSADYRASRNEGSLHPAKLPIKINFPEFGREAISNAIDYLDKSQSGLSNWKHSCLIYRRAVLTVNRSGKVTSKDASQIWRGEVKKPKTKWIWKRQSAPQQFSFEGGSADYRASRNEGSLHPAKLPIKINFPEFGREAISNAIDYLDKCDEFLALRPMMPYEIMATMSSVLKGSAKSWWVAERKGIQSWEQFKTVFRQAFPSDFQTEVEDRLRSRVQLPDERILDFAYDYRALYLRWKPDLAETEVVHRILNTCNPKLASCLRGTVETVAELVHIRIQVERDSAAQREYWAKANSSKAVQDKRSHKGAAKKPGEVSMH
ncbi:UNVERIFIED_CONTAM: hypothetical protein FKN15_055974 [Acipenser sinensis]